MLALASAVLLVAVVFGLINLPSTSLWAVMGQVLRGWRKSSTPTYS